MLVFAAYKAPAQTSISSVKETLPGTFDESDLSSLRNGETVVKVLPADDKKDVAVCGLVRLDAPAEMFLDSFRDNMVRKSNPAILEIGTFSQSPALGDLQALTIDDRDIEDLRACVVGDCKMKLSAAMISRFQKEIDWNAPNYRMQAAQLFKQMLVGYIRDYIIRGDTALINYSDKSETVAIAKAYQELMGASAYDELAKAHEASAKPLPELVESIIVWSKIKFGLKPVININHISIYRNSQRSVSQVLIVSKQLYADHYFESSLGLTAYLTITGPAPETYLFYENRSRLDGLEGPLGKIKRGVIEDRALASLTSILNQSKLRLDVRAGTASQNVTDQMSIQAMSGWKMRKWYLAGAGMWLAIVFLFTRLRTLTTKPAARKRRFEP
jgi:hypothetical protein